MRSSLSLVYCTLFMHTFNLSHRQHIRSWIQIAFISGTRVERSSDLQTLEAFPSHYLQYNGDFLEVLHLPISIMHHVVIVIQSVDIGI